MFIAVGQQGPTMLELKGCVCVCVCLWTGLRGRPTAAGGKRLINRWALFAVTPKKVKEPIRLTAEWQIQI